LVCSKKNIDGTECGGKLCEIPVENNRNRLQGPWLIGMCCNNDHKTEWRFYIIEKRDRQMLLPIIEREVEIGICNLVIVNHTNNFLDLYTGAHT